MGDKAARVLVIALACVFWFFAGPRFAFADVYRWVDEKGGVHFADSYDAIPEKFRDQVEKKSKLEDSSPQDVKGKPMKEGKPKKETEKKGKSEPKKGGAEKQQISKRKIESDVEDSLKTIVSLWKDEKYGALYDYGSQKSKTAVSKENFERQMARKVWGLASSWETIRDIEVDVKSPTTAYATAKLGFKPKRSGETKTRTVAYQVVLEKGVWRVDLKKILDATN
jgi:hypothetical protein